MTFKELLHEIASWTKKDQRVSYRAIKRQFDEVDDEYLEDLRDALEYAFPIESEEKGFRWTGDSTGSDERVVNRTHRDFVKPKAEAERRRITVMFCDLAESTKLAQGLDPEDLREIIRSYQGAVASVIHKYDGYIAQYLGDGLLIYFGWPRAHENDAERSILAALDTVESITDSLNNVIRKRHQTELGIRIGIHTGLVVVGEMGGDGRYESLATGDTVNIASRIEGLAPKNSIVISDATYKMVQDKFEIESLGLHSLKGVTSDIAIYRVLQSKVNNQTEANGIQPPFLVGRDEEIGLLNRRWEQAKRSLGQVVLISGTAGIGKSGLVDSIRAEVRNQSHDFVVIRCSSYHQNSAFYPLSTAFEQVCGIKPGMTDILKRSKVKNYLEIIEQPLEHSFPYLCALLSVDPGDDYEYLQSVTPQKQKQLASDAIVSWLFKLGQVKPILLIWEDLHWADPSTLDVANLIVDQIPTVPLLAVFTYRPQFIAQWRPYSHMTPITLNRLEFEQTKALIDHLSNSIELPVEVVSHIVDKTDGVPLFIEELTRMLLDSPVLNLVDNRYQLSGSLDSLAIPDNLQDSLLARLDQLQTAKEIAQLGSVIGREFSYESIEAVHTGSTEALRHGLDELLTSELLYARGRIPNAVFTFKHALVQDAAYNTLLRTKRQKIHQTIAEFIESHRQNIGDNQPELIAHHYSEGHVYDKALEYWVKAGNKARQKSSHIEAIAHARQGLQIINHLSDPSPYINLELDLYLGLGPSLIATKSYAFEGVGEAYHKALMLARQINDPQKMFAVLWGMCSYQITRADHLDSQKTGQELNELPTTDNDGIYIVTTIALAIPCFSLSNFGQSVHYFGLGIQSYSNSHHDLQTKLFGMNMGVFGRAFGSHAAWQSGQLDLAQQWCNESLDIANEVSHPFTIAMANAYAAVAYQFRGDVANAQKHALVTIALTTEQQFTYYKSWGMIVHGWAVGIQGSPIEGEKQIEDGIAMFRSTGSNRSAPYYMSLLAEVQATTGNIQQAIGTLDSAIEEADRIHEHWWFAELHRMKGDYLYQSSETYLTEACDLYRKAIAICDDQGANSQRVRAAIGLARALADNNDNGEAATILNNAVEQVEASQKTMDLVEATSLLTTIIDAP